MSRIKYKGTAEGRPYHPQAFSLAWLWGEGVRLPYPCNVRIGHERLHL